MSSVQLKPFSQLTEFQQWIICYLQTNTKMLQSIEYEINNFCDNTKNNIDLNNFDQNMAELQHELNYFLKTGLIQSDGTHVHFTTKGDLYRFQNLDQVLDKLNDVRIQQKLKASPLFQKNQRLCITILNSKIFSKIAPLLINNKKESMENIRFFGQLIIFLLTL